MKVYCSDFNGVLTDVKAHLAGNLATPADADKWLMWQDIRGSYSDLIMAAKKYLPNPPKVYTMQHGGHSTTDYGPPNDFKMISDKYLCWGTSDYTRMLKFGYPASKLEIVGCPLNAHIKPRVPHKDKTILFIPINTGKEEPENLAVYYELLKLKYDYAKIRLLDAKLPLKDHWGFDGKNGVSFNEVGADLDIIAKLLPWHDKPLYHGQVLVGFQDHPNNMKMLFELYRNVDLVVSLDESTSEFFAYAHDLPVITVSGFEYRQYGNSISEYKTHKVSRTGASLTVPIEGLAEAVRDTLRNPDVLKWERMLVSEAELGLSYGDAVQNIMKVLRAS